MTPLPQPKYAIGEQVCFDRSNSDHAVDRELGPQIDTITTVEAILNAEGWRIFYYFQWHDDDCPEECVLGPVLLGEKR